jgi:hypothetical protein
MFCLLLVGRRKKKREREKQQRTFFTGPKARHTLLAVLGGIFVAVRCN